MPSAAPRIDDRLIVALGRIDDRGQPVAEIWRRLGARAAELGLPRPSYEHVRRLLAVAREREDAHREVVDDIVADVMAGRAPPNAYELARRWNSPPRRRKTTRKSK